ncbi:MAG: LacI family DNA-binding transcriptional regulator [Sporolactobacillus sp.]
MLTIRDIATKAGVSVSTASRALNNNPRISEHTRQRVQDIANSVGYLPNYNAKNLTRGEANVVGVVFPATENSVQQNPFYIEILRGINQKLASCQYIQSIAIADHVDQLFNNVKTMVNQAKVKRFILLYSYPDDPIANYLRERMLAFVIIGEPTAGCDYYVNNDNYKAGAEATNHLLSDLGSTHPVFAESTNDWRYEHDRKQGFIDLSVNRGVIPLVCKMNLHDRQMTDSLLHAFIIDHDEIDGLVAADDQIAFQFYYYWRQHYPGKELPVISYNLSFVPQVNAQTFHSVDLFPTQLGTAAVQLLFNQASGHSRTRSIIVPFDIQN